VKLRVSAAVAAVAAVCAVGLLSVPPATAQPPGTKGKVAGFGITTSNGGEKVVTADAGRMAATGANAVMLEATWYLDDQNSNEMRPTSETVPDRDLVVAARRAQQAGLSVMLTTKLVCRGCHHHWRGALLPRNRDTFFENYRAMSNHYADLAAQMEAVAYFIGSEMNSTQNETDEWRQVILETRERYQGRVGYQVNWDSMREVDFWDDVDIAGISVYTPLSDALQPNLADLLAAWRSSDAQAWKGTDWFSEIRQFAASHGKPVLFGEIGYQSASQATQRPWQQEKIETWDPQLQADAYQAALTMFEGQSWWLGAIWWEWKVTSADENDLDYSPRGKLAEELLTRWYAGAERPATREQSLVGVTRESAKGKPVPPETTKGPTSPDNRTEVSVPRPPSQQKTTPKQSVPEVAPKAVTGPAPAQAAAAPPPAPPVESPATAPTTAAPAPEALGAVPVGTIEEQLARAEYRGELRRAALGAGGLLAAMALGHAVVFTRRVLPRIELRATRSR
jgi:hypothetical protein